VPTLPVTVSAVLTNSSSVEPGVKTVTCSGFSRWVELVQLGFVPQPD